MTSRVSEAERIYDQFRTWLVEVLPTGGSLFNDDAVWTEENIDELTQRLLSPPADAEASTFQEKLQAELRGADPAVVQLAAEVLYLHLLQFTITAITASTKRNQIETVLSWMPEPPGLPEAIVASLDPGILHPGQYVMSQRSKQLGFLLSLASRWNALGSDGQAARVADPWTFRQLLDSIEGPGVDPAKRIALHLAFPDVFEPITSMTHLEMISKRFADLAGDETDIDRRLLAIRSGLESDLDGPFEYYEDPSVALRWLRDPKRWKTLGAVSDGFRAWPLFDEHERDYKLVVAEHFAEAKAKCEAGDADWPEAVKSAFTSKPNNLTTWMNHDNFLAWVLEDPSEARELLLDVWSDPDPAEGIYTFAAGVPKRVLKTPGAIINIGSVLLMATNPTQRPPLKVRALRRAFEALGWPAPKDDGLDVVGIYRRALLLFDEIVLESQRWENPLRDRLDAQGVVWSALAYEAMPDGMSDTWWDQVRAFRSGQSLDADDAAPRADADSLPDSSALETTDHIAAAAEDLCVDREVLDEIVELLDDKGQVVLYGPPGTGKTYLGLRLAKAIAEGDDARVAVVQFHPATSYEDFIEGLRPVIDEAGQVSYELVAGPLVSMAEAARREPDKRFVLVVDEINRANLPKVFGELLILLEYRDQPVRLINRPEVGFTLPKNLLIIGTMNTADRSVALIDAAMRRRFHFRPFFPHEPPMSDLLARWLEKENGRAGVARFLEAVNKELLGHLGEHLLIGPSHFMKKTRLSDQALEKIWTFNVFPLVEELFWGDSDAVKRWRWPAVLERHGAALHGEDTNSEPVPEEAADDESGA